MRRLPLAALLALSTALAGPALAQSASGPSRTLQLDYGTETGPASLPAAPAAGRYAVVLGNGDYAHAPDLPNAVADAELMAGFLASQGFHVIEGHDLDKRGFEDLMRRVLVTVRPNSELVFYFAGHGLQIGRRNYLLPTDADLDDPTDVHFETITVESVVAFLSARSRLRVVILDSCRDNPFADALMMTEVDATLYEAREGFSPMTAPVNTLIAYATSPGRVAYDGGSGNSPYTSSLIEVASSVDAPLGGVLERVRRAVYARTEGLQVPWESSTLVEPFFFAAAGDGGAVAAGDETAGPGGAARALPSPERYGVSGDAAAGLVVEGPLERAVPLGRVLAEALELGPGDRLALAPAAGDEDGEAAGWLALGDRTAPTEPLDPARLRGVVHRLAPTSAPPSADPADDVRRARYALAVARGDGALETLEVELRLVPNACDRLAGDWLDPEGVGLALYPNEIEPEAALAACDAALADQPEAARLHHQRGRALLALRRFDEARAAFEQARELGSTRALTSLGLLLARQDAVTAGVSEAPAGEEALSLYLEGVNRGDPYAYHSLGKQLLRHGTTETQRRYGFELLTRALELGHTFSMNELGFHYLRADSPEPEPRRGLRYLTESASRGDIYGFHNLGLVYDQGLGGVPEDPVRALEWYVAAAEGGHPNAPVNIGRLHVQGRLPGGPDFGEAIAWYDRGLARGAAWGGANAAWIIANEAPRGFSPSDAAVRAAKAAVLADEGAAAAAREVLAGLAPRDLDRASQTLLGDLGRPVTVDGVIGPQTEASVAEALAAAGLADPGDDPLARLEALARAFWVQERFRVDL